MSITCFFYIWKSKNGIDYTVDKVYLLSSVELAGADDYDKAASATHQLEYYVGKSSNDRIKQYQGSNNWLWLRTAPSYSDDSFRSVGVSDGGLGQYGACYAVSGVAPAFRIG